MVTKNEKDAIEELEKRDFVIELKSVFSLKWVEKFILIFLVAVAMAILSFIITNYIVAYMRAPQINETTPQN